MFISCSIEVGNIAKATANFPESTILSSSLMPLMPPIKSMRLSVRGSPILRTGASKLS